MGYEWKPKLRIVPTDGHEETIDLLTAFGDTKGPVRIEATHELEFDDRQDINRVKRPYYHGARGDADITLDIFTMANQTTLVRIINALMLPHLYTVYLSLDDGLTWRWTTLHKYKGPTPLAGKPSIGARYEFTLRTAEVLDEVPAIGTGTW